MLEKKRERNWLLTSQCIIAVASMSELLRLRAFQILDKQ